MPDEKNESGGFKVVDRRPFGADGTRRDYIPAGQEAEKQGEFRAPHLGSKADQSGKTHKDARTSEGPSARARAGSAPLSTPDEEGFEGEATGFETLVSYLSTTAMFQLGLLAGPGGERIPPDFVNARHTLDILEVLQEKTRGNLSTNEVRLLDEVLYELRMRFVALQKQLTQKRK